MDVICITEGPRGFQGVFRDISRSFGRFSAGIGDVTGSFMSIQEHFKTGKEVSVTS